MIDTTLGQNVPALDALHLMDGIEGLRSLPRHSVDMLLTDPPYGTTRNYWDVPLPLIEFWEAVRWAVCPVWNCSPDRPRPAGMYGVTRWSRRSGTSGQFVPRKECDGCPM